MRIALAAARFVNGDAEYNLKQIERWARAAKRGEAALVCFGEAFLQGFDALSWNYEADLARGLRADSEAIRKIAALSREIGIDISFGFIERDGDDLYSSCALAENGSIAHIYRRITVGWKARACWEHPHYREGDSVQAIDWRGKRLMFALCGDLWELPERFTGDADALIWPVYIDYLPEEWANARLEYALQAARTGKRALMINSLDENAFGACCDFESGGIRAELPMGEEGLLLVEI